MMMLWQSYKHYIFIHRSNRIVPNQICNKKGIIFF